MFEKFFNKFLVNSLSYGFGSIFLGIPFIAYYIINEYPFSSIPICFLFFLVVGYFTYKDIIEEKEREMKRQLDEMQNQIKNAEQNQKVAEHKAALWIQTLKERASGFPNLFNNIAYYEKLLDDSLSNHLMYKSHPAVSSAKVVQNEAKRRREAEFQQRTIQALIEYYENIAPFLLDFRDQLIDENDEALKAYTEEERQDPVTNYMTKDEYRKLTSVERNQMALDRYWRRPKSKWLLGRMYERYVGYLYEEKGYFVDYVGIFKGFEDLGRDLICQKGKEIIVIQCKNWSQFKTIFEKHIFQFFGTVFQYRDSNKDKNVKAIFYTTTVVSDLARRFAKELRIELAENFKFDQHYPCIKCNISRVDGTKIYHLPFDQQYDNTCVEPQRGEFYCLDVKEAEEKGFRRAFRWHSNKQIAFERGV